MIWHSSSAEEVIRELNSDKEQGLSSAEVFKRSEIYGKNELLDFEEPRFLRLLLDQFKNYLNIVLLIVAVIYFAVSLFTENSDWTEALLIILILCVNGLVGAVVKYRNISRLSSLRTSVVSYATVIRDGTEQIIPAASLVPGDIMLLNVGDYVKADGRIIDSYVLKCDELSVTGETVPVEKMPSAILENITPLADRTNMVYSGSYVLNGKATIIVTETAADTAVGRAESIVKQTRVQKTPFAVKLEKLSKTASIVSLCAGVLVFFIGVIAHIKDYNVGFETTVLGHLLLGLALAVSAMPEGLSTVLDIAVSFSAQRLKARNLTMINLPTAESVGDASVICADKTGIFTSSSMSLVKVSDGRKTSTLATDKLDESAVTLLRLGLICSNLDQNEHLERHANSLEAAIERACAEATGMGKADIDSIYPRLAELPFDSVRRMMTTVTIINSKPYAIVKGAPEVVISKCNDADTEKLSALTEAFADEGLKVMAIALKALDSIPANPNSDLLENNLIFVGLLGFDNPCDPLCAEEIAQCKAKGISVVMMTGDHIKTAVSAALELGIINDESQAISHDELEKLSDEELSQQISNYFVFARITPEDKLRLVKAFRNSNQKVLITCDSVNDVPALIEADYGCALGLTGSDSVKASADFIVDDNRFSTLTLVLKESNRIFDSVLRSIKYLLSCNAAEILTVILGLIIFGDSPLAAVSLLWINFITDSLPALAFSSEVSTETLSLRKHENKSLFGKYSLLGMAIPSALIALLTLIAYGIGLTVSSSMAATLAFAVLGICQTVQAFTLSHTYTVFVKSTLKNLVMPIACGISLLIILILIATPVGSLLSFTIPNWIGWLVILLSAAITLAAGEGIKFARKRINK